MSSFGEEFEKTWPLINSQFEYTEYGKKLLKKCADVKKPQFSSTAIEKIVKKSDKFPIEFPIDTCRVKSQPSVRHPDIEKQITSAYPIIHERVLGLYLSYLEHKKKYGNRKELAIYKGLSLTKFIDRLLEKRCASCILESESYLLVSGESGYEGFPNIGTDNERKPLVLKNVLCLDEVKLSALLSVSSHSEFINNGSRMNAGIVEENKSVIESEGVIIGVIGAYLKLPRFMEFQDIVITERQNTKENGYGMDESKDNKAKRDYRRIWNKFYDEKSFEYNEVEIDNKRFGSMDYPHGVFDNVVMKKRYAISFDTLLLECEARAIAAGKQAFIHVVGIGLGVWKVADQQEKIFLETFTQRLKTLIPKLPHVSVVYFSWFQMSEWKELRNGALIKSETHPEGGIRTFLSRRNPADALPPEHEGMLVCVSYAWDGNALPGNEFWTGSLKASGDPAAACSTLIAELHNPHINKESICGDNLYIASPKHGVIHIAQYAKLVL